MIPQGIMLAWIVEGLAMMKLPAWVHDRSQRDIVAFLGGGLVIAVGALWGAYVHFDGKKVRSIVAQYYVCNSPWNIACPPQTTTRLEPGASIAEWAEKECGAYKIEHKAPHAEEKHWWSGAEVKCEVTAK
jgi:hypothetical protein